MYWCNSSISTLAFGILLHLFTVCHGTVVKLSPKEVNVAVRYHNRLRTKVAIGEVPGQPKAADMYMMKWSKDLQTYSEKIANRCTYKHATRKDMQTVIGKIGANKIGENMARRPGGQLTKMIKVAISHWYSEHKYFRYPNKKKDSKKDTGHYKNMMAGSAYEVGCAIADCRRRGKQYIVLCNYAYQHSDDSALYSKGKPCSKCDRGDNCKGGSLCVVNGHEQSKLKEEAIRTFRKPTNSCQKPSLIGADSASRKYLKKSRTNKAKVMKLLQTGSYAHVAKCRGPSAAITVALSRGLPTKVSAANCEDFSGC